MTLTTDDSLTIQLTARDVLARSYPPDRVAALADGPRTPDPQAWSELEALGWFDPDLPPTAQVLLAEECGYHLTPQPWWSTMCVAALGRLRPGPAGVALRLADGLPAIAAPDVVATPGEPWVLSGAVDRVPDVDAVTSVLVEASSPTGPMLFCVDLSGRGVVKRSRPSLDPLRPVGEIVFTAAPAERLYSGVGTAAATAAVRSRGLLLLAAEAVGVAQRAYDIAREHACTRQQFGRPIGSYQAVAFRIADVYVDLELARSLTRAAAADGAPIGVSCALVAARRAAIGACEQTIQVLGGIGMTWEHPVHRWYRRALWIQAFGGSSDLHYERVAQHALG